MTQKSRSRQVQRLVFCMDGMCLFGCEKCSKILFLAAGTVITNDSIVGKHLDNPLVKT